MSLNEMRLANILFEPEDKYVHSVNEAVLNEAVEDVQGYIETLDMLKNGLVGHRNIKAMIEELHDELSNVADEKSGRLNQIFGKRKKFATATENLKTQIWDLYKKLALSSPLKAQFEASKRKLSSKQLAIQVEVGRTGAATGSTAVSTTAPTKTTTAQTGSAAPPTAPPTDTSTDAPTPPRNIFPKIGAKTTKIIDNYLSNMGLTGDVGGPERQKIIGALNAILDDNMVLPEYRMRLTPFLFEDVNVEDPKKKLYSALFKKILNLINDSNLKNSLQNKEQNFIDKMTSDSDTSPENVVSASDQANQPSINQQVSNNKNTEKNSETSPGPETGNNDKQNKNENELIKKVEHFRNQLEAQQDKTRKLEQVIEKLQVSPKDNDEYRNNLEVLKHDLGHEEKIEGEIAEKLRDAIAEAQAAGIEQNKINPSAVSELRARLRKLIIKEMYSLSLQDLFEDDFKHSKPKSNFLGKDKEEDEVDPETGFIIAKNVKKYEPSEAELSRMHKDLEKIRQKRHLAYLNAIPDYVLEEAVVGTSSSVSPKKKFVNFKIENFDGFETEPVGSDLLIAYENTGEDEEEYDFSALGIQGIDKISIPKDVNAFYIVGSDASNKPAALPDRFSSESGSKTPDKTLIDLDSELEKTKSTIEKSQSAINDLVAKKAGLANIGPEGLQTDFAKLKMLQFTSNYKLLEKMMTSPATSSGLSGPAAAAAGAAAVGAAAAGLAGGGATGDSGRSGGSTGGVQGVPRHSLKNALSGIKGIDDSSIEMIKQRINPLVGNIFNESVSYDQNRLEVLAGIRKK